MILPCCALPDRMFLPCHAYISALWRAVIVIFPTMFSKRGGIAVPSDVKLIQAKVRLGCHPYQL